MGLYFQWCRESEHALLQCRYDRRALPGARAKFNNWSVNKLVTLLMKNAWKVVDAGMTPLQRTVLEALTTVSVVENKNCIHYYDVGINGRVMYVAKLNFCSFLYGFETYWMTSAAVN